ncbi:hypothetical protein EXIGLDRAFT_140466 [Exidia glandulosa HHB12029]|uniref:Uncharacterized protein n=1 Tax=Exidia glandulosa HHB12029 TaxID=1314781 RepID=A0A165FVQ2_EXIGL|nr:hypothetical protein EXIGLDRAFT_140466 [Exidia glandulosa HHB12029]
MGDSITQRSWWSLALGAALVAQLVVLAFSTVRSTSGSRAPSTSTEPRYFDIGGPMKQVLLGMENTVHYQIDSPEADAEWELLAPQRGIVHVDGQPYLLGVFHQMRCLDVVRRSIRDAHRTPSTPVNVSTPAGAQARHCLQYLRQMILCRANSRLEVAVGIYEEHNVHFDVDYVCKDWSAVYAAAADNRHATS